MIDLTKTSLDTFLCSQNNKIIPANDYSFITAKNSISVNFSELYRDISCKYKIYHIKDGEKGDVVLLCEGNVVGFYWGDLLAISPCHQNLKLSTPLIIEAVKYRMQPETRILSEEGKAALTSAWNVANGKKINPWP